MKLFLLLEDLGDKICNECCFEKMSKFSIHYLYQNVNKFPFLVVNLNNVVYLQCAYPNVIWDYPIVNLNNIVVNLNDDMVNWDITVVNDEDAMINS